MIEQVHVQWRVYLLFNANKLFPAKKNLKSKNFLSFTRCLGYVLRLQKLLKLNHSYVIDHWMPSIWFKTSNYKITHLIFQISSYKQWQKIWGRLLFAQFFVFTPFLLLKMLRNNEQNLREAIILVVCNFV